MKMASNPTGFTLTLSWETEHNTSKGLMVHTFSDRVKVVTDIRSGTVKVYKDGIIANLFSAKGWSVSDYAKFLSGIAANEAIVKVASSN